MKKTLSLMLALAMTCSLAACGGSQKPAETKAPEAPAATEAAKEEAPKADGKKIKVKVSMTEGMDSSTYKRAEEYAAKINADCGDIFDFQIFPNDQLGSYDDVTAEAINGTVEMIIGGLSTKIDPRGSVAYTPYLCTSLDKVSHDYGQDSFIFNLVTDIADGMGLKFLGFDISGMEGMSVRGDLPENPLDPASDKGGMQIRTTGSPMPQALMNGVGYTPITVAWNEVYSATQSGMINGFLGANAGSAYNQFRDVIDHYLPINFAVDANRIVLSGKFWDSLTAEQQESFATHATEIFEQSIAETKAETEDYYAKLREAGVDVVEISQEQLDVLANVAKENCWPTLIETYGQELYDDLMAFYTE